MLLYVWTNIFFYFINLLMFYCYLYFKPIPFYILQLEKDYMYVIEKLRF